MVSDIQLSSFTLYIPWGKTFSFVPRSVFKKKYGVCGGIRVSQTHLVTEYFSLCDLEHTLRILHHGTRAENCRKIRPSCPKL